MIFFTFLSHHYETYAEARREVKDLYDAGRYDVSTRMIEGWKQVGPNADDVEALTKEEFDAAVRLEDV